MNYRMAEINDMENICTLVCEAIKQMENQGIYQWDALYPTREDFTEDICKNSLYVVEDRDRLAAIYAISQECEDEYHTCAWKNPDDTACVIHRFCVSPDFQHRGVGTEVLHHIETQLREFLYTSVRLDVYTQNPYAVKLYKNSGYEERGYADWRKGRFILMEKSLYLSECER
ncbi:MAG: GNAT family N-acetyltransferase [Roseburia sp.]|nr:GNAT family N-acetyltransferase [Roseburia sp.]